MIHQSDNEDIACYNCRKFLYEGIDGYGWCDKHQRIVVDDEVCECHKLKDSFK